MRINNKEKKIETKTAQTCESTKFFAHRILFVRLFCNDKIVWIFRCRLFCWRLQIFRLQLLQISKRVWSFDKERTAKTPRFQMGLWWWYAVVCAGNYLTEAIVELFSVRVSCVVVVIVVHSGGSFFWWLHTDTVILGNIENTCMDLHRRWPISVCNLISEFLLFKV